ncbi:LA2681 family HEPN domain-containing protein [Miniphocaeibacter halophilus]|uniref:Uncharacterized protein n=1 Tax=Miniphocaeibacter halophilus TaxID=2931922 RepID=A0AC61MTH6_9FIRM|nr:LA2681 family HEPN domain-containing protein [Miniphocaeibacter halophilus]QQK09024.1 hypothetical protein JFY71_05665 [Miniphocaeibacter halophilus]
MESKNIKNPLDKRILKLQKDFDNAFDNKDKKKINELINKATNSFKDKDLNELSEASLYYSIANGYNDLITLSNSEIDEKIIEKILYFHRMSINIIDEYNYIDEEEPYFIGLMRSLYTNYANILSTIGRIIEAIKYFKIVLTLDDNFAMAMGNLGISYMTYSNIICDKGHKNILNYFSYHYLKNSIKNINEEVDKGAKEIFMYYLALYNTEYIEKFLSQKLDIPRYSLGRSNEEKNYRNWCLENNLFLNPMNDLPIKENFIARDIVHLPDITMPVKENINYKFHIMYNNLKEEFISSRFLYYEALEPNYKTHYSDRDVYLINNWNNAIYSVRIEKLKNSFKLLYSILDKSAFFLNEYYNLNINENEITFRNLWENSKEGSLNILPYRNNYGLNAIRWLYKDIFVNLHKSPNPHSKTLHTLRNALEHKYIVVTISNLTLSEDLEKKENIWYISERKLQNYTLQLLHMVRELLIYLVISVNITENEKKEIYKSEFIPLINADNYDDEWKI